MPAGRERKRSKKVGMLEVYQKGYDMSRIDYNVPACPVCGEECVVVYRDRFGEYVGCNVCIEEKDACEWMEDQRYE